MQTQAQPAYVVQQRSEFCFAVLGPNPDAGKNGIVYGGTQLTVCTTDGREDAELIAAALNAYPAPVSSAPAVPGLTLDELDAVRAA